MGTTSDPYYYKKYMHPWERNRCVYAFVCACVLHWGWGWGGVLLCLGNWAVQLNIKVKKFLVKS